MKQPTNVINENKVLLKRKKSRCIICGEEEYCCLEVHHIRDKIYNISQAVKILPTKLFSIELSKTICVCSNCHKKLHNNIIRYDDKEIAGR